MSKYLIKDNVIFKENSGEAIILSAVDIYDSKEHLENLGLSFSKLSLEGKIVFSFKDAHIVVSLVAIKNNDKYDVKTVNRKFLDYIIINNTWYYLTFDNESFNKIIDKLRINIDEKLDFNQYLNCKSELKKSNIDYVDDVSEKISEIKAYSPSDIIDEEINGSLFTYQNIGFNWLSFMYRNNCGAVLADEMGLGKTLQIIALFAYLRKVKNNSHFLVACPLSLLENWKREINKFAPNIKVLVHHGANRTGLYKKLLDYDVIVTSYSNIQSDLGMINMIDWDLLVVDEAQNIKNPYANRTKFLKEVNSKCRIAVTGTPFENHIEDIWSIIDFVLPDYLGTLGSFKKEYIDDIYSAEKIEPLITPLMLRRRVVEVADDLPPRVDIPQPIIMTDDEAVLYEGNRKNAFQSLKELKIDKIQKLRLFCTHPYVYSGKNLQSNPSLVSSKYQRLCEIVEEIVNNEEKVLIFTSFNKMNELLVSDLKKRFSIPVLSITGETDVKDRQSIIDDYSNIEGAAALILNPKAAGAGLNITAANHVIHYNLEWNPAIEDQASARAYRRGQSKTVFIYRLFYVGTIEEIINEKILKKRDISNVAIIGNQGDIDKEDLERALNISPIGGMGNA